MDKDYCLYYRPGTCAVAPHIALELVKAPYDIYLAEPGDPKLLAANPLGAVPTLMTPDLGPLTQNEAILKYLGIKFPETNLMPNKNLQDQYHFNNWMSFLTGDWHPTFWPYYNWKRFTTEHTPLAQSCITKAALIRIKALTAVIDQHLQKNTYMTENRLTLLDPYAYAIARWIPALIEHDHEFPGINKFIKHMQTLPEVQTVLQQQQLDL